MCYPELFPLGRTSPCAGLGTGKIPRCGECPCACGPFYLWSTTIKLEEPLIRQKLMMQNMIFVAIITKIFHLCNDVLDVLCFWMCIFLLCKKISHPQDEDGLFVDVGKMCGSNRKVNGKM